jgi:hypothetical protein
MDALTSVQNAFLIAGLVQFANNGSGREMLHQMTKGSIGSCGIALLTLRLRAARD